MATCTGNVYQLHSIPGNDGRVTHVLMTGDVLLLLLGDTLLVYPESEFSNWTSGISQIIFPCANCIHTMYNCPTTISFCNHFVSYFLLYERAGLLPHVLGLVTSAGDFVSAFIIVGAALWG